MLSLYRTERSTKHVEYNGGIISDIFQRDSQGMYISDFASIESAEAFHEGQIAFKPKGISGAVSYDKTEEQFFLWLRKKGKQETTNAYFDIPFIPQGNQPFDPVKKETIYYQLIDPSKVPVQHRHLYKKMYKLIDHHKCALIPLLNEHNGFLTMEWLHNSFPFHEDPVFCIHTELKGLPIMVPNTFDALKAYFQEGKTNCYGLVYCKDRKWFKVEANGFVSFPQNNIEHIETYSFQPDFDVSQFIRDKKIKHKT